MSHPSDGNVICHPVNSPLGLHTCSLCAEYPPLSPASVCWILMRTSGLSLSLLWVRLYLSLNSECIIIPLTILKGQFQMITIKSRHVQAPLKRPLLLWVQCKHNSHYYAICPCSKYNISSLCLSLTGQVYLADNQKILSRQKQSSIYDLPSPFGQDPFTKVGKEIPHELVSRIFS